MNEWVQQFQREYQTGQEEGERLPYLVTTFTNNSTGNPSGTYVQKAVQMMGGEQVIVMGNFDFRLSAGAVYTSDGFSESQTAAGKLQVQYPGGTVTTFSVNQSATLQLVFQGDKSSNVGALRTTLVSRANVSFIWPIEARMQTGGEHIFTLVTTGDGSVQNGQITIVVV